MYRSRYINKYIQFGEVNYTLILEDLEGDYLVPLVRIEKTFSQDPSLIDDDFLSDEANKEILRIISEQENGISVAEKDLIIEDTSIQEE